MLWIHLSMFKYLSKTHKYVSYFKFLKQRESVALTRVPGSAQDSVMKSEDTSINVCVCVCTHDHVCLRERQMGWLGKLSSTRLLASLSIFLLYNLKIYPHE